MSLLALVGWLLLLTICWPLALLALVLWGTNLVRVEVKFFANAWMIAETSSKPRARRPDAN